jgi:hypothetical protein
MKHCAPRDPQRVPKPKYEATARQVRLTIGYPNSTTGSMDNGTAFLSGEAIDEVRPRYVSRYRPKHNASINYHDMFHDMFVH